jgi:BirA family biotin operon repressor/biotin-[acetyl-CoA-carboxylase] ligase
VPLESEVIWLDEVQSTNSYLANLPRTGSARIVATWNQTGGRGRLGRQWVSPPGKSLAFSLELWPDVIPQSVSASWLGSLSLLTGVALAEAIGAAASGASTVKWPNDVLIESKKVAGVLGEIPESGRVVVGVGLNAFLESDELPTSWATSLNQHAVETLGQVAAIVESFLNKLHGALVDAREGFTPELMSRVEVSLATIGQEVRAEFPDGSSRTGEAVGIDRSGRLRVLFQDTGTVEAIDSADVWHLRPAR